jgi:hypothetical protein
MKIGLYYQAGYRYVAAYNALKQFRKFYPEAPVAMYEDNSFVMKPIAKKFNCHYSRTLINGFNDPNSGRPAYDLKTILGWFDRVYEACTTVLVDADWIMNFEDDVWFKRPIERMPKYDLSGIPGVGWNQGLYEYLGVENGSIYGCGGSVFNRVKFIEAYKKINEIKWDEVANIEKRPLEWTDSAITFLFMHAKFSVGPWEDAQQYRHSNIPHMGDRMGWPGTMEELENEQGDISVIHCWKPYYYPSEEEIKLVDSNIKNYHIMLSQDFIVSRLQGRTGNMMFQIAHGYAKALEYNRKFVVPYGDSSSGPLENNLFRRLNFSIRKSEDIKNAEFVSAPFEYADIKPSYDKPTIFAGWFQSEKYFEKHKEAIRDLYSPPLKFVDRVLNDFPFFGESVVAAINVRRGDYLNHPRNHPVITIEYIQEAYKQLPKHDHLIVVSDDIPWCRENINFPNIIFVDPEQYGGHYYNHEGIWLLSLCDHFIISNSSFSWWGAWLSISPNKVVIAPDTWFGPEIIEDTKDIYCDDWIKIPTYWDNGFLEFKNSK